ncbi:restriction endonuclease subunit S [Pseudoalteromonas sp. DL-6]|uniref:restriction endonuclease subunit S n=1 Tax=Pseudoalteromonas sp. DL-6 TaxID=1390185 RepID=UPI0010407574|nr:restriction endonuclease subunit S [Pseudoalteromonas sp. DL-6]QBJ63529.1 restriction endonuclease [Pseudoalteromonas sp. DL-6]
MAESKTPNTNAEQFITEHLDIWTTAIEQKSSSGRGSSKKFSLHGIKKLRELILDLAVRGKLVPQDPNDEPASVLLERIAAEKAQLVKDKKIKKPKALPEIGEDEKPYGLPVTWSYSRLGDVVSIIRGITFPASEKYREASPTRVACLRTANVQDKLEWDDLLFVESRFVKRDEQYLELGDIVMSMANSRELVGKVSYVSSIPSEKASFGGFLSVIRPYNLSPSYLMCLLRCPLIKSELIGSASQTTNIANISLEKLNPLVTAIPPLKEQHRIASKVDELMGLCDALETQTENSIAAHQTLVEVLLEALLKAPEQGATPEQTAEQFQQNWQRLSEHFDTLFTTTASIDTLKQTILQLAVMGKLVPQNPTDEPAAKLLERIAAEKAQLIKDKKIKKQKPLPEITDEEKPFELPKGWEWVNLGELVTIRGGKRLPKGQVLSREVTPYIYIRVSDMRNGSIREDDLHYITEDVQSQISNYIITTDDLYMTIVGATIGKCGLIPIRFNGMNLTENAARLTPFIGVEKYYLFKYLDSDFAQEQFFDKTKQVGVQKMALNRLSTTKVPLPSVEEQRRIVTKVDELMALCDQLKARLTDAQTTKLHLTDIIVESAVFEGKKS